MYPVLYKTRELYILSYLDKNTLILARDIKRRNRHTPVIFACSKKTGRSCASQASAIGCTVIRASVDEIYLPFHISSVPVHFVLADPMEDSNLNAALKLTAFYRNRKNVEIYSFNSTRESELLFDSINKGTPNGLIHPVRLRRVNLVRNLIYQDIFRNSIFDCAIEEYREKIISVLIIGMGNYGFEMVKALLWCGQMDGYVLRIHILDVRQDIETRFYKECPGIRQRGSQPKSGEDYYELYFHPGIDVDTEKFADTVKRISPVGIVFISLGNEQKNIETAIGLRVIYSGMKIDAGMKPEHDPDSVQLPRIIAVVHSDRKSGLIRDNRLSNYQKQYFSINCIGADSELFSYENVFSPTFEAMAYQVHSRWGNMEEFNNYEYNRRSSLASAIHKKYRDALLPTDETKDILEHKRWNAYMRSTEGYTFGLVRDDLALRHPLLVKYDQLSRVEKDKDSNMNREDGSSSIF